MVTDRSCFCGEGDVAADEMKDLTDERDWSGHRKNKKKMSKDEGKGPSAFHYTCVPERSTTNGQFGVGHVPFLVPSDAFFFGGYSVNRKLASHQAARARQSAVSSAIASRRAASDRSRTRNLLAVCASRTSFETGR
jgi:hypothetical protein